MNIGVLADQGVVSHLLIDNGGDVLKPWSMRRGERILRADETRQLVALLQASAAFGPPANGLRLPDVDSRWPVASCQDGVWGFQRTTIRPTLRKREVRAQLFAWDTVPVPVNPPRKLVPAELRRDPNAPVNT